MSVTPLHLHPDVQGHPDAVVACLASVARRFERSSSPLVIRAGLATDSQGRLPFHQISSALDNIGLRGRVVVRRLARLKGAHLPAILSMAEGEAVILLEISGTQALVEYPHLPAAPVWEDLASLADLYAGSAVIIEPDPEQDRIEERPWARAARKHWFWSEVRAVSGSFGYVALAAVLINLLAFALPLFSMNVYDRVIPNRTAATLWVLAIGVMLAFAIEFSLRLARARLLDEVARKLDARLSQKLFEKVMNLPLAAREGSTGAFAKRVTDFEQVRDFFASTTVVLVIDSVFIVLFLVLIAFLGGWLVMVPIVGMVLMIAAGATLQRSMATASREAQADSSLQQSMLIEAIAGQATLKAARAEGRMLGRWQRYAQASATTQESLRRLTTISINLASLSQQSISIGLVIGGFYLFNAGAMSMGAIIAIVMLAGRALAPVGQFAYLMTRSRQAMVTMNSIQSLFDIPDERRLAQRSVAPQVRQGNIALRDVCFAYPQTSQPSLTGINLTIAPGERIGVIGRIASGKSTLGRVLCGLYPPGEGSYLIDGLDVGQYHPHEVRGAFRFVAQDADIFSGTVRDNLALGGAVDDEALIDAVKRSGADLFLTRDAAGFDELVGERGSRLSGGQRSFLLLARALVEPSKLLFLDEPTGAMDTQSERWFIDHLTAAIMPGQTLIVSTHRMALLEIVDRLIVLDGGRIVADGPRDAIVASLTKPQPAAARTA